MCVCVCVWGGGLHLGHALHVQLDQVGLVVLEDGHPHAEDDLQALGEETHRLCHPIRSTLPAQQPITAQDRRQRPCPLKRHRTVNTGVLHHTTDGSALFEYQATARRLN